MAWLTALVDDPEIPVSPGPYVPDMPDRLVVVTVLPGGGLLGNAEPAIARPTFQVRWRGDQNDGGVWVEGFAHTVDKRIITAPMPVLFDTGDRIVSVAHVGGLPAPLGSESNGDQVEFTCTYTTLTNY